MARHNNFEYEADDWREHAMCSGIDPNVFFPPSEEEQLMIAATVCGGCAVRAECLNYALRTRQDDGVWGGATESERRQIRSAKQQRA